jgi:hypothetical protein
MIINNAQYHSLKELRTDLREEYFLHIDGYMWLVQTFAQQKAYMYWRQMGKTTEKFCVGLS